MIIGLSSTCLNNRARQLMPKDIRNTLREPKRNSALLLHSLVESAEPLQLAYKPQNWTISSALSAAFLPEIDSKYSWHNPLREDTFLVIYSPEIAFFLLLQCNHLAIDATHAVCDVSFRHI